MTKTTVAGVSAVGAGVMFLAAAAVSQVPGISDVACASALDISINVLDLCKYLFMAVTVLLLITICGDRLSRLGQIVGRVGACAAIVAGVANGIEHCAHLESLGLVYAFGLLLGVLGTAVFGVFVIRSKVIVASVGWIMVFGMAGLFVIGGKFGGAVAGVAWLAAGTVLFVRPAVRVAASVNHVGGQSAA